MEGSPRLTGSLAAPIGVAGLFTATPFGVGAVFFVYGAIHAAIGRLAGPVLALDDAKLNVSAQSFQGGYLPANPPLFEWLLFAVQSFAGHGPLSFALVKTALFAATGAFAFFAAREVFESRRAAALAALSLLLVFQLGWNYHQAFTHTTALVAATALFWAAGLRLLRTRRLAEYALFGAAIGIGLLAKYSFAGAAGAMLAGLALQREGRRVLADPRIVVALFIAAAIVAPHAVWVAGENAGLAADVAERLDGAPEEPYFARIASGVPSLVGAGLAFFLPLALVVAALAGRGMANAFRAPSPPLRLLRDGALIGAAGLLLAVLVIGMPRFDDRYAIAFLYPGLFCLLAPLYQADGGALRGARALLAAIAVFAVGAAGFRLVTALFPGPPFCNECRQYIPYDALAAGLRARGFEGEGALIGFDDTTAGNLRRLYPKARVFSSHMPFYAPPAGASEPCYFVWSPDLGPLPPDAVITTIDVSDISVVEATTRQLAGVTRRVRWNVAALSPQGPLFSGMCARASPL